MMRHWSTDTTTAHRQFAYWREAVCEAVLNVATERPTDSFYGEITCAQHGDLRFVAFASAPHRIVRSKEHIAHARDQHFLISLQRSGTSRMFQGDEVCELRPGDVGLIDGTRPFRVEFTQAVDRIIAVVPYAQLFSRAPWLEQRPLHHIARDSSFGGALRFYLERLAGPDCASSTEAAALTENVCNIVALLTADSEPGRCCDRELARLAGSQEMLILLRRQLADPDLSPHLLAKRLKVSVRTVHRWFQNADTTFGQWVLEHRLLACRRAFDDPAHGTFTVSQIAFGWGFNDLSHFSKAFKARFGVSPTEYRQVRTAS